MENNVKNIPINLWDAQNAVKPSRFWFLWLLADIALIGAPGCTLCVPMMLVGRLCYKPLELLARRLASRAIRFMFSLNPWLYADIDLRIPNWACTKSAKPMLSISNHRSHLDAFFLLSFVPGIRMIAKGILWNVPFLGPMMRIMRQIPINPKSDMSYLKAMERARQGLRDGDWVHVFVENTRCSPGFYGTQKFSLGAFQIAVQEQVPIMPIVFLDTDKTWPKGVTGLYFRRKIIVKSLPEIDSSQYNSPIALMQETKRQIDAVVKAHYDSQL